jgi:hypothetical protein
MSYNQPKFQSQLLTSTDEKSQKSKTLNPGPFFHVKSSLSDEQVGDPKGVSEEDHEAER